MNWKEKLEIARMAAQADKILGLSLDFAEKPAPESFIAELSSQYPFCPDSLKELLRISDGIVVNFWYIAGSPQAKYRFIFDLVRHWRPILGPELLPFGTDAGSGSFFCDPSGVITLRYIDNQAGTVIAKSMDSFIDDLLTGNNNWAPEEWMEFVKQQGWL